MKYIIVLGDGMADYPVPELQNRTPLEAANKPNMDFLAQNGEVGMVNTVPAGMKPGSDTANLSVMGYDPKICYTGRSPLEAVSIGIPLDVDDVTFRCNLVTLSGEDAYQDKTMVDYSSDEIQTEESTQLIHFLNREFGSENVFFYPGISYRHCLVLKHAKTGTDCTPPHDISLQPIRGKLPKGQYGPLLSEIMEKSYPLLMEHPINRARMEKGLHPASSCWFWGEGTKPKIDRFETKYNLRGGVISAVDLIKGIGLCAGMKVVDVPGATGNINTNFSGKADAALKLLEEGCDFVYIHVEAPDECGHRYEVENKVKAIERIDRDIVGRIRKAFSEKGEEFSMLVLPDHPTPLSIRTHTGEPVPYVLYRSNRTGGSPTQRYTEALAKTTGLFVPEGCMMIEKLKNT